MAQPKARYWFKARYTIGEALEELPDDEAGIICKAIWNFAEKGEEPEDIPQKLRPLWKVFRADLIQDDIDRANGAKGGNPSLLHPTPVQGGLNPGSTGGDGGLSKEKKRKEDKDKEKDIDIGASAGGKQKKSFIPPSVEEVRQFCQENGYITDPELFVDYYQARGWYLKPGQQMKDWKASVRYWERNRKGGGNNGGYTGNQTEHGAAHRPDYSFLRDGSDSV